MKRLIALFSKRRLDADLDAEIAAHLELAEKEAIESGLSLAQARRKARLQFGGIVQVKEEHRDRRSIRVVETFTRDLRYGLAAILRDRSFSLIAIGVLAIGIGANTAMFSLVDATLLKSLPFPHPERIVRVWETPSPDSMNSINTMDFLDWKRLNTIFEALSVERPTSLALTGEGEPVRLDGRSVSPDYFQVFGVDAALGRTFLPDEDAPGSQPVVVLSHATWQSFFGGASDIVGRDIVFDGQPHTVVGVLPPGTFDRDDALFYKPLIYRPDQLNRSNHWLRSVGRLKPGVTLEQAQTAMTAIDAQLTELSPFWKQDWGVAVEPYDKRLVDDTLRRSIQVAFGAVALVLLIACANVANLLLTKGAARKREMAVRAALGASRGRLIGQLLTESLVLCLLGAVAGMGLAQLLISVAKPLMADSLPFTADVGLDPRVLAFSAVVALSVSLLIGLLPSLQTSFTKLGESMSQGTRGSSASREGLRRVIVIGEVAVSLVLICGSLLLFKSLFQLQQVDAGVRTSSILTMSTTLPQSSYSTPESAVRFYREIVERLESIPGIDRASVSTALPLDGVRQGEGIGMPGREGGGSADYKRIDLNYLDTLEIPLIAGRGFEEKDGVNTPPVALINEQLAKRLMDEYEIADPVGQIVWISTPNYENSNGNSVETQIVGSGLL